MKKNDEFICLFNDNYEHLVKITSISSACVNAKIIKTYKNVNELDNNITIFISLPKSKDIWERIIKKSVELGVKNIVPFVSQRSSGKYPACTKRTEGILIDAAQQSERGVIFEVLEKCTLLNLSKMFKNIDTLFICDSDKKEDLNKNISSYSSKDFDKNIGFIIGPEGGFSGEEVESFLKMKAKRLYLGKTILRVETAVISALTLIKQLKFM